MEMKTDTQANVGKHAFELAGLGKAPFRFVGCSENVHRSPDGTTRAGGSCDFCGTGIRTEFRIRSSDGKVSKVGCNCIAKVGDTGLLKAYKSSPEFRALERAKRDAKAALVNEELDAIFAANEAAWKAAPHPRGFVDWNTKAPLSKWDDMVRYRGLCGASGRAAWLPILRKATKGAEAMQDAAEAAEAAAGWSGQP
jgi:hypothetical protein